MFWLIFKFLHLHVQISTFFFLHDTAKIKAPKIKGKTVTIQEAYNRESVAYFYSILSRLSLGHLQVIVRALVLHRPSERSQVRLAISVKGLASVSSPRRARPSSFSFTPPPRLFVDPVCEIKDFHGLGG